MLNDSVAACDMIFLEAPEVFKGVPVLPCSIRNAEHCFIALSRSAVDESGLNCNLLDNFSTGRLLSDWEYCVLYHWALRSVTTSDNKGGAAWVRYSVFAEDYH